LSHNEFGQPAGITPLRGIPQSLAASRDNTPQRGVIPQTLSTTVGKYHYSISLLLLYQNHGLFHKLFYGNSNLLKISNKNYLLTTSLEKRIINF